MRYPAWIAMLCLALVMTLGLHAQTVRIIFVSGHAEVKRPDEPVPHPATKGESVIIGTRIVTGADGRVVLTPLPGVKSIITPNTTLILESVSETRTSSTTVTHQAMLDLKEGTVVSDLQKPEGVTYDYSVRTVRGVAGARGTTFTVGINPFGIQTVVVAHGTVSVSFTDGSTISLAPGNLSITKAGGETQKVSGAGQLSEADQKIAQASTETMVSALTNAIESGIKLDPAALNNALDAAKGLGITLPPELQSAVDSALKTLATQPAASENTAPSSTSLATVVTETVATPIDSYRTQLTSAQLAVFDTLPVDVQTLLATLNDPKVTDAALALDKDTGLPSTDQDLRFHLAAIYRLPAATLAFVESVSGPGFENAPDPAHWSLAAFDRTLASWNTLTQAERDLIVTLGAGEAIMDVSPAYISGLLAALSPTQQTLVAELGWGSSIEELAGKPTGQPLFAAASSLTSPQRATVKFFGIDPDNFRNPNISSVVQALSATGTADQQLLRQLGIVEIMLQSGSGGYSTKIAGTLSFYNSLTTDQQVAARALGLGYLLYNYAPSDTLGASSVTALQKVTVLTQFYTDHPALQQAIRDTGLFMDPSLLSSPAAFDATLAVNTLNAYLALPERTRLYLSTQEKSYNFFNLANPPLTASPYRTLAEINSLLGSLTAAEFGTLQDMGLSQAVIETGANDTRVTDGYLGANPLSTLRATLAYYAQLDSPKKFVLRELGVIGDGNIAVIGADTEGLGRLLAAYATLPASLRATTETLDESFAGNATYGNLNNPGTPVDRSFFFPRGLDASFVIQNIAFQSTGDLRVGATRYLRINDTTPLTTTFATGTGRDLYLYASDLIDLNATTFSASVRSITMAAATINLANLTFPEGSVASLNSKLGQVHFGAGPIPGYVNFNNVNYGATPMTSLGDARGNIAVGTLAAPAPLPTTYSAP